MTDTPPRDSAAKRQEIYDLALALLDCTITAKEAERLAGLVSDDREARRHYVRFMYDAAKIRRWSIAAAVVRRARPTDRLSSPVPPINAMERFAAFRLPVLQPFLGSVLLSYLLAVSILGAGVLAAWMWRLLPPGRGDLAGQLPSPQQVARQSPHPAAPVSKPEVVGRITRVRGLTLGDWKHRDEAPADPADVVSGCLYQMGPGAIEIAYNCGAKVVVEGPATYLVVSANSGALLLGSLRVTVNQAREAAGGVAADAGGRGQSPGLARSAVPHGPRPLPCPLFVIHTWNADLEAQDAEFSVRTKASGETQSDVDRGWVTLSLPGYPEHRKTVVVRADGWFHVTGVVRGSRRMVVCNPDEPPEVFALRLPKGGPVYSGLSEGAGAPRQQQWLQTGDPDL